MAQGYEDGRFEKIVDKIFYCLICTGILKDPVQCRRNEHNFCRNCITTHLQHSRNCPTCKDPLTVETLVRPQRLLVRARKEIRDMKADMTQTKVDMADMKAELKEVRSKQDEMFKAMQNMMANLMRIESTERNTAQRSEAGCASSAQSNLQAEIVVAGGAGCKSVEVFNMVTKTWRPFAEMIEGRGFASSVLYQGQMMVTGGLGYSGQRLDSVEELNLAEQDGHWVESQFKLPVPCSGHSCVVHQNRIFIIGGYTSTGVSNSIHDIQLTPPYTSRLLTEMPQPVRDHAAEIVNDKVYIIGGCTTGSYTDATDTVLAFDPATNTCTQLKPLPYPVSSMATVTWRDNVLVLGGRDKKDYTLNKVTMYNTTTGSHRMLPGMRKRRGGCTAVTIGDNIIVMGGLDETGSELNSVECYNFDTNSWTEFPAMAEARWYAAAVVVRYC